MREKERERDVQEAVVRDTNKTVVVSSNNSSNIVLRIAEAVVACGGGSRLILPLKSLP